MSFWNQLYFSDANSRMAARLFNYHDLTIIVVVVVMVVVVSFIVIFVFSGFFIGKSMHLNLNKHETLELFWSTFPAIFLVVLGYVSLKNLYNMEVGEGVDFLVGVTGHQWYWEYRYEVNFNNIDIKEEYFEYFCQWFKENRFIDFESCETLSMGVSLSESMIKEEKSSFRAELFKKYVESFSIFFSKGGQIVDFTDVVKGIKSLENLLREMLTEEVMYQNSTFSDNSIIREALINDKSGESYVKMSSVGDCYMNDVCSLKSNEFCSVLNGLIEMETGESLLKGISSIIMEGDWYFKFDSYIVPEEYLESSPVSLKTGFRNQDVGLPCFLVRSKKNEVIISTSDVFHSWGVPELGVKGDAVPGRENSMKVVPFQSGMAFGFCYELCGAGHMQMPIAAFIGNHQDILWIIKSGILSSESTANYLNDLT